MKNPIIIAGIPFHPVTYLQAVDRIKEMVESDGKHYLVTPNPEMVVESSRNESFKRILQKASLSIPDGMGILWASYYLSLPKKQNIIGRIWQLFGSLISIFLKPARIRSILPQRVAGSDLLYHVVEASQKYKWRIFLLGAGPGVAKRAIDELLNDYPNAIFAGAYAGSPDEDQWESIRQRLEKSKPDILFVAYGSPAQEKWIAENLKKLPHLKVAIGVGGAFDFAAGKIKRAPQKMGRLGLEWLWRLIFQPWRWRRIWRATAVFIRQIYRQKYSR